MTAPVPTPENLPRPQFTVSHIADERQSLHRQRRELYHGGHGLHDRFTLHAREVFDRRTPGGGDRLCERMPLHEFRERFARPSVMSERPLDDLIERNPEFKGFRDEGWEDVRGEVGIGGGRLGGEGRGAMREESVGRFGKTATRQTYSVDDCTLLPFPLRYRKIESNSEVQRTPVATDAASRSPVGVPALAAPTAGKSGIASTACEQRELHARDRMENRIKWAHEIRQEGRRDSAGLNSQGEIRKRCNDFGQAARKPGHLKSDVPPPLLDVEIHEGRFGVAVLEAWERISGDSVMYREAWRGV